MIIICKECSTKFRLDESLLKETGSKVRCCVCKHIFAAYPPQTLGQQPEAAQPLPAQQGYFDSEESFDQGEPGPQQADSAPDDDDGLELDVDEEDDIESGGLDLGDDDSSFDDGGIDLGSNNMPGMDSGMNFDEDMDTGDAGGLPGMDFASDDGDGLGDMELDTEINLNLDQGEDIELDADSDMKKDVELQAPVTEQPPETESFAEPSSGQEEDDDFEFEFELDEEEKFDEDEEDLSLDDLSDNADESIIEDGVEEDFELSLDSDGPDEDLVDTQSATEDTEDDQYEAMDLEIDDDSVSDDSVYEIEEVDEYEEDAEYEIEEYEDDDPEFEDDDIIEEEYIEDDEYDEELEDDGLPPKPKRKSGKLLKFLVGLLMILLVGYGVFTLTDGFTKGPDIQKINFSIVKNLFNSEERNKIPKWAEIKNESLNGRYVSNKNTGDLFVITGSITNTSPIPLNNIEIEGKLMVKDGTVAKIKRVYCGNVIPENQLTSLNIAAINRILNREDGEQGSNLNIKSKEMVPFMLVFSNLPEELDNYGVEVTKFQRMKKK